MDNIKKAVAELVATATETIAYDKQLRLEGDIEVTNISDLQTQVRIKTNNAGTRYFIVQVKEQW